MEKNVGNLDAFLRFLLGCFLVYIGLVTMGGIKGDILGIIVVLIALLPFYMVITRVCFVFRFLNLSSIPKDQR